MELQNKSKITFAWLVALSFLGCGVKGRPLPPSTPPPMGRGEPTYKEKEKKKTTTSTTKSTSGEVGQ